MVRRFGTVGDPRHEVDCVRKRPELVGLRERPAPAGPPRQIAELALNSDVGQDAGHEVPVRVSSRSRTPLGGRLHHPAARTGPRRVSRITPLAWHDNTPPSGAAGGRRPTSRSSYARPPGPCMPSLVIAIRHASARVALALALPATTVSAQASAVLDSATLARRTDSVFT